jgi:hypothetical protein
MSQTTVFYQRSGPLSNSLCVRCLCAHQPQHRSTLNEASGIRIISYAREAGRDTEFSPIQRAE